MIKKIYLASRYSRREELLGYKHELEKLGYVVTSRWVKGHHNSVNRKFKDLRDDDAALLKLKRRLAKEDLADLFKADCLIVFTEKSNNKWGRGGRHVETGVVLGWNEATKYTWRGSGPSNGCSKIRIIAVGPCENIFHSLRSIISVSSWKKALKTLGKLR